MIGKNKLRLRLELQAPSQLAGVPWPSRRACLQCVTPRAGSLRDAGWVVWCWGDGVLGQQMLKCLRYHKPGAKVLTSYTCSYSWEEMIITFKRLILSPYCSFALCPFAWWHNVARERWDTSTGPFCLFPSPGVGEGATTDDQWSPVVTSGHQWHCVMGVLPGLCFKYADGVWVSFKVGTKLVIKQNVANTILNALVKNRLLFSISHQQSLV